MRELGGERSASKFKLVSFSGRIMHYISHFTYLITEVADASGKVLTRAPTSFAFVMVVASI